MTDRGQLQRLNLQMSRLMYVNCRGKGAEQAAIDMGGKLVKKELPHKRPVHALYEVEIPEKKFLRNEKTLSLFLSDPQVEGVYETKTPLWLRGVLQMGCVSQASCSTHTVLTQY